MEDIELLNFLGEETGCIFYTCKSINIIGYGYNYKNNHLWIVFKNQLIYCYRGISPDVFQDLQLAESKGKWVNTNLVKPGLPCKKYRVS